VVLLRDSAAIVRDGELEPDGTDGTGVDRNLPRPGVAHRVGDRLLRDAGDLAADAAAEGRKLRDGQLNRHVGRPPREIGHARERGADVTLVRRLRPEPGHRPAGVHEVGPREMNGGLQTLRHRGRQRTGGPLR
jgi:hypothetical protein